MHPETLVIDSCIAVKWFKRDGEDSVRQAVELLKQHVGGQVVMCAPALLPLEVANVLHLSGLGADELTESLELLGDLDIDLYPTGVHRLTAACTLARAHRLTVYDAVFLELAIELDAPLVTADRAAFSAIPAHVASVRLL
jgi:predicted nucleic acid-binding protein